MKLIGFLITLSLLLMACDANEGHVQLVKENLEGVGHAVKSMKDARDTVAASAKKATATTRELYKRAQSIRDTSTAKPKQMTREEQERKFDSIHAAMMK